MSHAQITFWIILTTAALGSFWLEVVDRWLVNRVEGENEPQTWGDVSVNFFMTFATLFMILVVGTVVVIVFLHIVAYLYGLLGHINYWELG